MQVTCRERMRAIVSVIESHKSHLDTLTQSFSGMSSSNSRSSSDTHNYNMKMLEIKTKFDHDITVVTDKMRLLNRYAQGIDLDRKETEQTDINDDEKMSRRDKRVELDEMVKEIKRLMSKVERAKNDIVNHYELMMSVEGHTNSKKEKLRLDLKSIDLYRDKSIEMSANITGWVRSNSSEFPLLIPYIERITNQRDP